MHLHPVTVEGTSPPAFRQGTLGRFMLLLLLAAGCGPAGEPFPRGSEPVVVGRPREWRVEEPVPVSESSPQRVLLSRAASKQAWHQAPTEETALALARAFFPELSWNTEAEGSARAQGLEGDALWVSLPASSGEGMELAAGPHAFSVRPLDEPGTPASRQFGGALFYGPRHFRVTTASHELGEGTLRQASRVEECLVLESARASFVARYEVRVPRSVHAVREASEWLEFLDARGTPVLRLHYPLARDARGLTRRGSTALRGLGDKRVASPGASLYSLRDALLSLELAVPVDGMEAPILIASGWSSPANMFFARRDHSATPLPSGRVLVAGGRNAAGELNSAEVYDPVTRTWAETASLNTSRSAHTATLLPSGRILVAGGLAGSTALTSAEVYDPAANSGSGLWAPTDSLNVARSAHTATLLASGKVLVAGGIAGISVLADAEVYDPAANSGAGLWTPTGSLAAARHKHTATLLPSGKILVAGGADFSAASLSSAEVYDPAGNSGAGSWSGTGALSAARSDHTATLLPSGRVLAAGGIAGTTTLSSAEVYDPAGNAGAGSWSGTGALNAARARHTATLLPSGKVLVAAGTAGSAALPSAELYDPAGNSGAGSWTSVSALTGARQRHTATLLPSGRVLITGGLDASPLSSAQEYAEGGTGIWTAAAQLPLVRTRHAAALLPSGRVLITGGIGASAEALSSAQVFDPTGGTPGQGSWSSTAPMANARSEHTATLLNTGGVLVVGGRVPGSPDVAVSTAEVYDPTGSGSWNSAGSLATGRYRHTATLLRDGKVLVVGGRLASGTNVALNTTELYDPAASPGSAWSPAGSLNTARFEHTATLLNDGRVFVFGGRGLGSNGNAVTTFEISNTSVTSWTQTTLPSSSPSVIARFDHTATLLPNGRVLVAGGWRTSSSAGPVNDVEVFNPTTNTWSDASDMNTARYDHRAVLLPDGRVLVTGGRGSGSGNPPINSSEVYDPATDTWTTVGALGTARTEHIAQLLPSGRVLVAGGVNASELDSAELYDGVATGTTAIPEIRRPLVSFSAPSTRTFSLTGQRLRGISEGSSGNHLSSPADFPIASLMGVSGSGQWRMSVTSFSGTSATVVAPVGVPDGYYLLSILTGAIPGGRVVYLDSVAPTTAPTISAPVGPWVTTRRPTFSGSLAEPYSTVTVSEGVGPPLVTATADAAGNWSAAPTADLQERSYTVRATAIDRGGQSSPESTAVTFTVDATPPAAPGVTPFPNNLVNSIRPTFTGTADPGSSVTVTLIRALGNINLGTATASASGSWSITSTSDLAEATHRVQATAADAAGNTSVPSAEVEFTVDITPPAAPRVTLPNTRWVRTTRPTFEGTADRFSRITLLEGGVTLGTVTLGDSTAWRIEGSQLTQDLPQGPHNITVRATDLAGNNNGLPDTVVTFTVDTLPPGAPTLSVSPSISGLVNTSTPTFSGLTEPRATIALNAGGTSLGTITADDSGSWSRRSSVSLAEGTYTVTATATDEAGNGPGPSASVTFTVDITPPPTPRVTSPSSAWINTARPSFNGTAEADVTIILREGTETLATSTPVGPSESWTIAGSSLSRVLVEGERTITVAARDAAGNESLPPATVRFTVDLRDPDAPVITSPSHNGFVNTLTPTFSGTAEPGSTVTVTRGSPATPLCTATAAATTPGSWSCTSTDTLVTDTTYTVTATATDRANNTSPASSPVTFTVDLGPPPAPSISSPANGSWLRTQRPEFRGTAEPLSTVSVFEGATSLGSAPADAEGNWSFTTTATLAEGLRRVTARATDRANNTGPASAEVAFNVDVTAPPTPTVAQPAAGAHVNTLRPAFNGTSEAHSTLTLTEGTTPLGTTTLGDTASWSIALAADLAEGLRTITVTARDRAGNTSSTTVSFTADVSAPAAPMVSAPANGGWVNVPRPAISGTAEPESTVLLAEGATSLGSASTNSTGAWSFTPGSDLAERQYTLEVRARDRAGNLSASATSVTFTVDVGPPPAPTITAPANGNWLRTQRPEFRGTAEPLSTVSVFEGATSLGSAPADAEGNWSFTTTATLAEGLRRVTARATDRANNTGPASAEVAFNVDVTAPPTPTVAQPAAGAHVNTLRPAFNGTSEAHSTLTLTEGTTPLGTTTLDATTSWSIALTGDLAEGSRTITVTARDRAGNTSSTTVSFTVDVSAPAAPVVSAPANNGWVNVPRPVISGTAEPESTVLLAEGATSLGSANTDAAGAWSFTPGSALAERQYTLEVRARDRAGNVSASAASVTFTVDLTAPPAPSISSPANNSRVNSARPAFSGTAEPFSTVTVLQGTSSLGNATADGSGNWSLTSTVTLTETSHTVRARATDRANNTSADSSAITFTVDLTRPRTPTVLEPSGAWVNTQMPRFSGTAEANSTLLITEGSTALGTVPADGSGNWSFTPTAPMSEAPHTVTITSRDVAGNESTSPATVTFTVDVTRPEAPLVSAPANGSWVNTRRPAFSGTAEAFSTVTLRQGTTTLATVTLGDSTSWSIPGTALGAALPTGLNTVQLTATDRAGNTSSTATSVTFEVDVTAPTRPVVSAPVNTSFLSTRRPTFTGTAEPGSTITVSEGTPATTLATTTTRADGGWSVTSAVDLEERFYAMSITATDRAGNTSDPASVSFTVDVTPPAAPVFSVPANGGWANTVRPTFSGTADPNVTITLTLSQGSVPLGSTGSDGTGAWSRVSGADLLAGTHVVTATATDAAGNVSTTIASITFIVDVTPPAAPVITSPNNGARLRTGLPTFQGTAEPFSTIRLFVDGNVRTTTATANDRGIWALTPTQALLEGTRRVRVTATDRAGNTSGDSTEIAITIDTTAPARPVVTSPVTDQILTTARPTITGTGEVGSILTLFIDGQSIASLLVTAVANAPVTATPWSYSINFDLDEGTRTLRVVASDDIGNENPSADVIFSVDYRAPQTPTVLVPDIVGTLPTFTGTAEPGAFITLRIDASTVASTIVVNGNGEWRFTATTALAQGEHYVEAAARDAAGNQSAFSPRRYFRVDTLPPAAPLITSLLSGQTLRTTTPLFSGSANPFNIVSVLVDDRPVGTANADGTGAWQYQLLPTQFLSQGEHTVSAIARNGVGTESDPSAPITFTVDSEPPGAPVVTSPLDNSFSANPRPRFAGRADPNTTVRLQLNGTTLTTVSVPASREWSFEMSSALTDQTYVLVATARDAAGNDSPATQIRFTVDTQVPDAPVISSPQRNETLNTSTPLFVGTAEANSTVFIFVDRFTDGLEIGRATTSPSGNWSFRVTEPLPEGSRALRVRAVDPAGNIGLLSTSLPFTVDTVVPGAPRLTSLQDGAFINDPTPTLSGSAEAGSTVTVSINNSMELSSPVNLTNAWSVTPETPLPEGSYTLVISSRDAVGNTNPETQTVRFTVDTTAPETQIAAGSPRLQDYPPTATFEFSSSEGGTFECSYNGADFATCQSPHVIENLDDGAHLFRVRAVDRAGNMDPEPVEFRWSRDLAVMEGGGCGTPGGASLALPAFLALLLAACRRSARAGRGRWRDGSLLLLGLLVLAGAPRAQAEEPAPAQELAPLPAVDLERLYLNPGRGTLLVGGGELLLPGTFRVALGGHYQNNPLRMRLGTQRLELISHRVTGMLAGAVGVLPWLELNVHVPVVPLQRGQDPSAFGLQAPASQGLGTPMAHARMGILSRRAGHLMDLAVDVGLGLPLGSTEALAREPIARLQGFAMAGRRLGPVRVALDGGLLVRVPAALGPANLTSSYLGQELRLGAGVSTVGQGLQLEAALRAAVALETVRSSAELLAGVRYPLYSSWLEVFAMGGLGLGSLPGTPGFRVMAGVSAGHPPPPETPVTRRASSWQQPLLREDSEESERPQPLRAPTQSDDEP